MPLKRWLPEKLGLCMSNLGTKCSDSDFSSSLVWQQNVDITCSSECFIYTVASFFHTGWFWNKYLSWTFKIADYIFKIKSSYVSQWNAWQVPYDYLLPPDRHHWVEIATISNIINQISLAKCFCMCLCNFPSTTPPSISLSLSLSFHYALWSPQTFNLLLPAPCHGYFAAAQSFTALVVCDFQESN